jgi:hypothetical protein
VRTFAPASKKTRPAPREEFTFTFMRDDEPEDHRFVARGVLDTASLSATLQAARVAPEQALGGIMRMIVKMLDNSDGTPARWQPTPWTEPLPGRDDDGFVTDDDEDERYFKGPDGQPITAEQVEKLQLFESGSSRRRWRYLIDEDDELVVDTKAIMQLFEWMVGLAAGRPTQPSV